MRRQDLMAVAVAVAVPLASVSQWQLVSDHAYVWLGALVALVLAVVDIAARRLSASGPVAHLAQLATLVVIGLTLAMAATGGASLHGLPGRVEQLFIDTVNQIETQAPPLSPSAGLRWLMVLLVGVCAIAADILAVSLALPAWALTPLLTLYLIPALALAQDVSWLAFALVGLAYLLLLMVDGVITDDRWARNLLSDTATNGRSHHQPAWTMAASIAAPAIIGSLVLGNLLPDLSHLRFTSARPHSNQPLQMQDPTIDLHKNLNLTDNTTVLTYTTTSPNGVYLRMTSLTIFDSTGFRQSPVTLKQGTMPSPPGLDGGVAITQTHVTVRNWQSEYLPAPYAPQSFVADGQWAWDTDMLSIISTAGRNRAQATAGLDFTVDSAIVSPDPASFAGAVAGVPSDDKDTSYVPPDLPQSIIDLTTQIVKGITTPAAQAAALEAYLSNPAIFTYDTTAPDGDGYDVLTTFLTDHHGYCIHFAAAMAVMARILGIPSRVSVGFLPGTKSGGEWVVTAHDQHAWPELYFKDYGWVRYEPTVSLGEKPAWASTSPVRPSASASTSVPSSSASGAPVSSRPRSLPAEQTPSTGSGSSTDWGKIAAIAGALAAVGLVSLPFGLRMRRRRRRLRPHSDPHAAVADAWAEVRDSVLDTGRVWPEGSPRERAAGVSTYLSEPAAAALARLAALVERSRYARSLPADASLGPALAGDVREIRRSLLAALHGWRLVWQAVAPRSLWVRRPVASRPNK